jgi:hypothetical protein
MILGAASPACESTVLVPHVTKVVLWSILPLGAISALVAEAVAPVAGLALDLAVKIEVAVLFAVHADGEAFSRGLCALSFHMPSLVAVPAPDLDIDGVAIAHYFPPGLALFALDFLGRTEHLG